MNKSILLFSSIFFLIALIGSVNAATVTIYGCRELDVSNTIYKIGADFTWGSGTTCTDTEDPCGPSDQACFTVTGNGITLDGNDKRITATDQVAYCYPLIDAATGADSFTVKDLEIREAYYPVIGGLSGSSRSDLEVDNVDMRGCSIGAYIEDMNVGSVNIHDSYIDCDELDAAGISLNDIHYTVSSIIDDNTIGGDDYGILLTSADLVAITDNTIDSYDGILLTDSDGAEIHRNAVTASHTALNVDTSSHSTIITFNDLTGVYAGLRLGSGSFDNRISIGPGPITSFTNFITATNPIVDSSSSIIPNFFSYVSPYGEINWTNSSFMNDLDISSKNLTSSTVYVIQNLAYVDSSLTELETSAQVSVYGSIAAAMGDPYIARDGVKCNATTTPSCTVPTDWSLANLTWSVSGWSNYSVIDGNGTPPDPGGNGTGMVGIGFTFGPLSKYLRNDGVYCPLDHDTMNIFLYNDSYALITPSAAVTDGVLQVTAFSNSSIVGNTSCNCSETDGYGQPHCFPCYITFEAPNTEQPFYFLINYTGSSGFNDTVWSTIDNETDIEWFSVSNDTCHWIRFDFVDSETGDPLSGVYVDGGDGGSATSSSTVIDGIPIGTAILNGLNESTYDWEFSKSGYSDNSYSSTLDDLEELLSVPMYSSAPSAYNQPFTPPQNVSAVTGGFLNIAYAFVASPFNWIMLAIIILLGLGLIKLLIGAVTGQ